MPKDKTSKKSGKQTQEELLSTLEYKPTPDAPIDIQEFDPDRLLFADPEKKEIPGGKGNYRTVKIRYHYPDGYQAPLFFQLSEKYCYGITPDNLDKDGNVRTDQDGKPMKMKNYQASMPMFNQKEGVTEEQQLEIDLFDGLTAVGKDHAVSHKKKFGMGNKADETVRDFVKAILFRKKKQNVEDLEEGESIYEEDYTPQLYTKLMYYQKDKVCQTVFYGPGDKPMDPRKIEGGFFLTPVLRIDSLYIGGTTITWQHKLYDGTVRFRESKPRQRMAPKNNEPDDDNSGTNSGDEEGEASEEKSEDKSEDLQSSDSE